MDKIAITVGAATGLSATAPMTVFMQRAHKHLPQAFKYPLPPRLITEKLASGLEPGQSAVGVLTLLNHFGYGAATGAIYGSMLSAGRPGSIASGIAFGLGVWAISYLGLLPGLSILSPATKHPPQRSALMIGAHVVWGGVLGWLTKDMLAAKPAPPKAI